jgi:hypothetical protein
LAGIKNSRLSRRSVGRAAALTLAGILTLAAILARGAATLAFAGVLALAIVLAGHAGGSDLARI